MLSGSCHCGAVRFSILGELTSIKECNCTVCRRYGALWAYFRPDRVQIRKSRNATFTYICNDKVIAFHICRVCGNLSHWEDLVHPVELVALNMRLVDPDAISHVPVFLADKLGKFDDE